MARREPMADRAGAGFLRAILLGATAASAGYQIAALLAARRWRCRSRAMEGEEGVRRSVFGVGAGRAASDAQRLTSNTPKHCPPISILKPLRGLEPGAESSFSSFCVQDYPEYELLFGVADAADPAADLVHALAERYPQAPIRLIETTADLGPNRKVCNLHGLAAAAGFDLLLVSDSDMRVPADYLRRIAAAFDNPEVGLVTCPYRGAEPDGVPASLEALGIAAGFMPGVFVAAPGRPAFAFGSTIALRRETLEQIGGFEGLVDYLADDFQMGKRVADLGLRVHLSSVVVDSVLGRRPFRETWARRLRWARTVRACRPLGHLGSGLTHTTVLALLAAAVCYTDKTGKAHHGDTETRRTAADSADASYPTPCLRVSVVSLSCRPVIAFALAARLVAAWRVAVVELESEAARRWFWLLPLSDLVEAALWVSSLFGRTVIWRGQRYRLLSGGRIARVDEGAEHGERQADR
jgi:ceramide glucosyltransferase